jgi:DNA-binding NarL/FixJ family response regulator
MNRKMDRQVVASMARIKTCNRCGDEFEGRTELVCPMCRRPRLQTGKPERGEKLTPREKQVIRLVMEAQLNKEIAFSLKLTEGTIKEYLNRIFHKLGTKNRTELAVWGIRNQDEMATAA